MTDTTDLAIQLAKVTQERDKMTNMYNQEHNRANVLEMQLFHRIADINRLRQQVERLQAELAEVKRERDAMIEKIQMITPAIDELEKLHNMIYAEADKLRRDYNECKRKKDEFRGLCDIGYHTIKRALEKYEQEHRQTGAKLHTNNLKEICDIAIEAVIADLEAESVDPMDGSRICDQDGNRM